jgi:opacity protein-like surface antigen
MRKSAFVVVFGGAALMGASSAAAQSAVDWSGPYVGLNMGWNWANTSKDNPSLTVNQLTGVGTGSGVATAPPTTISGYSGRVHDNGFTGGAQVGFNAVAGPVVWGLEADARGLNDNIDVQRAYMLPGAGAATSSLVTQRSDQQARWSTSLRGRVGFASGRALFYATGGPAWVNMRQTTAYTYAPAVTPEVSAANPGVAFGPVSNGFSHTETRRGWTVGGGAELMHTQRIALGLEYRHTWADGFKGDPPSSAPDVVFADGRSDFHEDAVLARVNVKFGNLPTFLQR